MPRSTVTEAFPLQWPSGFSRKNNTEKARFKNPTIYKATEKIREEIRRLGGNSVIVSSNLKLKNDGLPYSSQRPPEDTGVAVYFTYKKSQRVIACDQYTKIESNLWAIGLSIQAMRAMTRYGCSDMLERMFTGFTALPESTEPTTWWEILGVAKDSSSLFVQERYRELAKKYHPDTPFGSSEMMAKINTAYLQFKEENGLR